AIEPATGAWVIFADGGGVGRRLAARLESRGERAIVVVPQGGLSAPSADSISIDADDPADCKRAWTRIIDQSAAPLRGIVHLWSLDSTSSDLTASSLEAEQRRTCGSVLHLVKAIVSGPASAVPPLWLVTRGAQAVGTNAAAIAIAQAPLWGLAGALTLELPEIRCARVDLDPSGATDDCDALVGEL